MWRTLSRAEQQEVLQERKDRGLPWHRPPHFDFQLPAIFIITAACYEHRHIVGKSKARLGEFEQKLLECCSSANSKLYAWCVLPNYYHLLAYTADIKSLRKAIGLLHGRTSRLWNSEDGTGGRKVWFNYFDRDLRSERHYWASLNYIHNNAVHHGYVEKWQEWPYSSVHNYLESVGREEALRVWNEYPILDYGKKWDIY